MTITITNSSLLEQKIDKAIKQLPFSQSREQFIKSVVDNAITKMIKDKVIKA